MATRRSRILQLARNAVAAVALCAVGAAHLTAVASHAAPAARQDLGKPLADEAAAHFKEGRFQQAAELFERAFALNPEKLVRLRNAGRAYEEAGRLEYAKLLFERYLQQAPDGSEKDEVKQRVDRIDETLAARKQAELAAARKSALADARPAADGATSTVAADATGETPAVAWATLGGGVAMVAGGAVWAVLTVQAEQRKNSGLNKGQYSYPGGDDKLTADRAAILRNQIAAYATLGVGAIATGVGLWWAFLAPARPAALTVAPVPIDQGGAVVFSGLF
ncbi:MAG: tetratricopeptide repeat protein [Deltaproteobacteria bacterium]|nr:tetratricopeptide repeat protein [Deltaproteobacteria bacterium]